MTAVEKHDFTTTPECPWCGERECERHCAECGRERFYRDGRHMGEAVECNIYDRPLDDRKPCDSCGKHPATIWDSLCPACFVGE